MTHHLYALIEPESRIVMFGKFPDYKAALAAVGLGDPLGVDFGTIGRFRDGSTLSIIVYEYGLLDGGKQFPDQYWALGRKLFSGPGVIFAADEEGETTDIPAFLQAEHEGKSHLESHITWIGSAATAEALIQAGEIDRPRTTINGETTWEWKAGTP